MPSQLTQTLPARNEPETIALQTSLTMSEDNKTAEIMIYGIIVTSTAFAKLIGYESDDISASDFNQALKTAKKNGARKLWIRINSPGGYVRQAVAMRKMLMETPFDEVLIDDDGLCASAASLLLCVKNAHVRMAEGSELMIHKPRNGVWGTVENMESALNSLRGTEDAMCDIYANHTGQSKQQILDWMKEEKWFTAQQAVDAGFAHEVYKGEQEAVACVSPEIMQFMKAAYSHVPDTVAEASAAPPDPAAKTAAATPVSTETPAARAGVSAEDTQNSEEETKAMANENTPDVKTMSLEELRAQNPALYESAMKAAGEAESTRRSEIDAMTPPGYEAMATKAKQDGTSAQDYYKQVVAAQKEKAAAFVPQRIAETETAAAIPGAASETDNPSDPNAASDKAAQDIAAYAKQMTGQRDGGMY